jgi:hypothetical protein
MRCEELTNDVLADRRDGSLDPALLAEVETHLEACGDCRHRAAEVAGLLDGTASLFEGASVPAETDRAVAGIIRAASEEREAGVAAPPSPAWGRFAVSAAAAVLFAVAGFLAGGIVGLPGAVRPAPAGETGGGPGSVAELVERLDRANRERGMLNFEMKNVKAELAGEREMRRSIQKTLGEGKELLKSANEELSALRSTVESLRKETASERSRSKTLAEERDGLAERVSVLEEERGGSERRLAECLSRVGRLEAQNRSLSESVGSARKEVITLAAQNRALETRLRVPGDLNRDGNTDIRDVRAICLRLSGNEAVDYVEEADLNRDGKIDVADALLIAKSTMGSR